MIVAALWRSVYISEEYLIFGFRSPLWCLELLIEIYLTFRSLLVSNYDLIILVVLH